MMKSRVLDQLVHNSTFTSEGREWLTLALDPFHDYDHQVAGYPDADCDPTVVSAYQFAVDISRPAGLAADALWDAHVFNMPILREGALSPSIGNTNGTGSTWTSSAAAIGSFNMINVMRTAAGGSLFPTDSASTTYCQGYPSVSPTATYNFMTQRVIGLGFEVVDTTAEIYRQGALTVYRLPQEGARAWMYTDTGATDAGAPYIRYKAPPSSVASALLLTNAKQWDARNGAYVVCTQSTVDNSLKTIGSEPYVVVSAGVINSFGYSSKFAAAGATGLVYENVAHLPFNTSGVMLTGLNYNATFRLKIKLYTEVAPSYIESALTPLATPSAPYDPAVLEAYSKAMSVLASGVQAGDNASGDWWKAVLRVLAKIALPVSHALTPLLPVAPLVGRMVSAGASAAAEVIPTGRHVAAGQRRVDGVGKKKPNNNRKIPAQYAKAFAKNAIKA